jgi:hypothetical protein
VARPLVSTFLLPLVRGGIVHVGRPLGPRAVERIARVLESVQQQAGEGAVDDDTDGDGDGDRVRASASSGPLAALAVSRHEVVARFLRDAGEPPLDDVSLRLGAALHDLLSLGHPEMAGRGMEKRQERIAAAALALASVGPPRSAVDAVNRHSLLARLPEIVRSDSTVHFWLGRQAFVGRVPPRRVTALPALRRVRVEVVKRSWLREIGIPTVARGAFLALNVASPLGEALDPLRLDPPLAWSRILPALRFPELGRVVAGQMLEAGVDRAGDVLADALLRFASLQDPPGGVPASADAVGFALRFLSHLVWLDVLFGGPAAPPSDTAAALAGLDLAVMISAAAQTSPALVWPPDLLPDSDLGRAFRGRLAALAERAHARGGARYQAALGVAELGATVPTRPRVAVQTGADARTGEIDRDRHDGDSGGLT